MTGMALMVLLPLLSGPDSPATALLGDLLFDCLNCAVDVMQEVTGERYTSVQAVAADVVRAYTRQQCSAVMPPARVVSPCVIVSFVLWRRRMHRPLRSHILLTD